MTDMIRLGLLRLCDAAPVILADHEGLFAAAGIKVHLSVEPSWANIADKLSYGLLDGAVILPPLAMACAAGLRGRRTKLVIPMSLSANGNAVTLGAALQPAFASRGITGVASGRKLRFAVVHVFSTHNLLLRYWLAAEGIDPDKDVEISVLPPAEMVSSLAAGAIDGFCVGAPWGQVAAYAKLGFVAVTSAEIWRDHPEKCVVLRDDLMARDPAGVLALLRTLRTASALCEEPKKRGALAALLARPGYLHLPEALIENALAPSAGGPDFMEQYPDAARASWFATQMLRWNLAPPGSLDNTTSLYRPDLFLAAGGATPEAQPEYFWPSRK
ncbi:MAG: ABC transporter substrate-binding protein [Rhodospirillales bacterium]|nr:ABC transporter substrate-binding protein [Rhodospirillales bacterium]